MLEKLLAVLCWALAVHGQYFGDFSGLDNLGERIRAQVAAQVKPLEGLGDRINAQVQQSIRPVQVSPPLTDTAFSSPPIDLSNRLSELDGLGDRISQTVHHQLEPVRAIELNLKMRDGVGGITIITHHPSGTQFILKNHKAYVCPLQVDLNTGECPGSLSKWEITQSSPRSDWCYIRSYSLINNQICMSVGSVTLNSINGHVSCRGADNKPTILMSLDEYKDLCSGFSESAEYRYIPNENDPAHVVIPNENKYVKCENRQRNYCIFNERNGLMDTVASGGSGIFIRGGTTYF